jgi:hypothetical protein
MFLIDTAAVRRRCAAGGNLSQSLFHAIFTAYRRYDMTIEQTVEIPASHRLIIDLPAEIPAGRARITVVPELPAEGGKQRLPIISRLLHRREERQRKAIMEFAGCLKDSPAFEGDPVAIFRRERDEWDERLEINETQNPL